MTHRLLDKSSVAYLMWFGAYFNHKRARVAPKSLQPLTGEY
jgi:hypothetical protein